MGNTNFDNTVKALFDGADQVLSTKTVVGEPQVIGDTIIVPLVDVSFGMGAGTFGKDKSDSGAGGIGGKMLPSAVLLIRNGDTRLINVRNRDALTMALDMVPNAVDRISSLISNNGKNDPVMEKAYNEANISEEAVREEI